MRGLLCRLRWMIERIAHNPHRGFADVSAPETTVFIARAAQEQQPFQNLGRDGDEQGAVTGVLAQLFIVVTRAMAIVFLLEARDLAVEQFKGCDGWFLLPGSSEGCQLGAQIG